MSLLVIGDVHGKFSSYLKLLFQVKSDTLQLGDMGFNYYKINDLSDQHKFFGGNHDNYHTIGLCPNNIGDFGPRIHGNIKFFFIRGGFSIDKAGRRAGNDWWPEEELKYSAMCSALELYKTVKPKIMITHEAPCFLSKMIGDKEILLNWGFDPATFCSNTGKLLQACYNFHKPALWIHGHLHVSRRRFINSTTFISLAELDTFLIERNYD